MDEKIGQSLLRAGIMTDAQVEDVVTRQRAGDDRLFGEIAIAMGYINEDALQSYLGIKPHCPYQQRCHFYGIPEMQPSSRRLKDLYCEQAPKRCAIYLARQYSRPVPINLWPTGKIAM
jgi:hypothetical protein